MKYFIAVLITALFITSILTEDKEHQENAKDLEFYITNWDQYQIPKPLYAHVLKDVLNKIELYKRNSYCRFKRETCEASLSDVVMKIVSDSVQKFENGNKKRSDRKEENSDGSEIGSDRREGTADDNNKSDDSDEGSPDSGKKKSDNNKYEIATNGEINNPVYEAEDGKLADQNQKNFHNVRHNDATKMNSSINDNVIINVYKILQLNVLADEVDNKTLDEAKNTIQKLYGSYYSHLKVDKKYRKGYIKKFPFDPYLVKPG